MAGYFLLGVPIVTIFLLLLSNSTHVQHTLSVAASFLMLLIGASLTRTVIVLGSVPFRILPNIFYMDAFSIIMLDIVLLVSFLVSIYSVGYMSNEIKHGKLEASKLKLYYISVYAFLFTMLVVLTVKNMGIMWIAIEATTLASVYLVGLNNTSYAMEAAWKYVIICSVGIAIALLGIMFLHLSSIGILERQNYLDWTVLYDQASNLSIPIVKLAFIFILIGYGTKAGLAPMHTWLPDAHSQAPSPISALLSGVLLNSAMYGIIRTLAIVNRTLGSNLYTSRLLIVLGLLSILTAAIFITSQNDYKRLLAYSSIEHMGIVAVAMGIFSPLSIFGGLLHMVNHSLTKSMLFLTSGNVLQKFDTREISKIHGVLKAMPISGIAYLLGLFAIAGTPPFSVFSSELSIISSTFLSQGFGIGMIFVLLLAIVFAGIAVAMFRMFYGNTDETPPKGEPNLLGTSVIVILLLTITVTGLMVPEAFQDVLTQAQKIIAGV